MAEREEITTIKRLKQVIREATEVNVQPRFGVSEKWIRCSKKDALFLIHGLTHDRDPAFYEMTCDIYGTYEDGVLSLG